MIRVLLADDHKLLIDGLRSILDGVKGVEIAGVASDGIEAAALAGELKPDIVLMDISMPRLNGIDASRQILRDLPETRILILSMHADKRYIKEALRAGASGYILKESASEEVIEAIRSVRKGKIFFSRAVREQVIGEYIGLLKQGGEEPSSPLSPREREVLQLLAEGKSTKEIAAMLSVSVKTIETHRKQIMDKLDMHSIAELTKYAIREGLTQID